MTWLDPSDDRATQAPPADPEVGAPSPAGSPPPEAPEPPAPWTSPGAPPPPPGAPSAAGPSPALEHPAAPLAPWGPPGIAPTGAGATALRYGRTVDRAMAWWLDSLLVAVPAYAIAALIGGGAASSGLRLGGASLVAGVIAVGIDLLYFVAFWTGSSRATPAMRLMRLQIGDAATGAVPTVRQGLVRWLALGGAFQVVEILPGTDWVSLASFAWVFVLLASTVASPTKQGLHDRVAGTALVQPLDARTPARACLVLAIGLVVVWLVAAVALVLLGGQISGILSSIGASV